MKHSQQPFQAGALSGRRFEKGCLIVGVCVFLVVMSKGNNPPKMQQIPRIRSRHNEGLRNALQHTDFSVVHLCTLVKTRLHVGHNHHRKQLEKTLLILRRHAYRTAITTPPPRMISTSLVPLFACPATLFFSLLQHCMLR